MMETPLENFSEGYVLAPTVEVNEHNGEEAMLDFEVYEDLVRVLGEPIIGFTGGLHYQFVPSDRVPAERAAIPKTDGASMQKRMSLLLMK